MTWSSRSSRGILDGLPVGTALDAACGTGRHAEYLASLGHTVIGVDSSPEMLAAARATIPGGKFHQGDLHQLPAPDQHVDVVVCALALTHVPELAPVLAEFARVLRPGGHLVIPDSRNDWPVVKALPGGEFGYLPHRNHPTSDYLAAALPLGLHVRRCEEPRFPYPVIDPDVTPPAAPVSHPSDIWSLQPWCPAATNAAYRDAPVAIIWHFQLGGCRPARSPRLAVGQALQSEARVRAQGLDQRVGRRRVGGKGLDGDSLERSLRVIHHPPEQDRLSEHQGGVVRGQLRRPQSPR